MYMHLGDIVHAGVQAVGTLLVLAPFLGTLAIMYAAIDMLVHYHIDWSKLSVGKRYDLQPNHRERFWILLDFNQLLHHITYFVIVYFAFSLSL